MSKLVALDPGHGGYDSGAVDGTGPGDPHRSVEKHLNMELVPLVADILRSCDVITGLTRQGDVFVSISERARRANVAGADYFVSVHFNAGGGKGMEILYTSTAGRALAHDIYKHLAPVTPWRDRGLKHRDDLGVLNRTAMPAVLVEVDFIDNDEAEALIHSEGQMQAIAEGIARGICEHVGAEYKPQPGETSPPDEPVQHYGICMFVGRTAYSAENARLHREGIVHRHQLMTKDKYDIQAEKFIPLK